MATVILHKDFERISKENEMNNIVTDVISIRKLVDGYWGVENLHNIVPARSMLKLARSYGYEEAPVMHLEIFFDLGEFGELPEEAAMLAYYMTCLFSRDFQCVYALHEDGGRLRVHILVNTICMHDGHIMYMNEMVAAGIFQCAFELLKKYSIETMQSVVV